MPASSLQEGALVCQITHSWSSGLPCGMGFMAMCMFLSLSVHMSAAAHRGQKRAPEFLDVITGSGEPMWELAIELRPSASTVHTFNVQALYLSSTVSWQPCVTHMGCFLLLKAGSGLCEAPGEICALSG